MLNNAETFREFGWKMNHKQLRVKDEKILNVDVKLNQHCEDGYRSEDWEGVGTKCVRDNRDVPSYKNSAFIQYIGQSEDCMSLAGEARLRDFVHKEWPFPCIREKECEAHFTSCSSINSGKCAIMVHLIFYEEAAGLGTMESNLDRARDVEYQDGTSFKYSEDNSYKFRGSDCGADPRIQPDGSFTCSESCDSDNGYRLTRSGNCQQCPYGTWFNDQDPSVFQRCHSCGYYGTTIFDTVNKKAEDCFPNSRYRQKNSDGVWTEDNKSMHADLEYEVNAEIEMHLCEVVGVKNRFERFCSDKFSMERMSLNDFTDYNVEMLGCMVMQEFSEIYEHSCRDFQLSWSDIMDDFEWGDVACFVAKGIHTIEDRGIQCEYLSDNDQKITMPFEISEYFDDDMEWANAIYLPLFSHAKKMERFSFDAVSNTVEGVFRKFGIFEMTKLTGLEMMDYVRDMILAIPRGLSVKESDFEFKTAKDDIYCQDGSVKVQCYTYDGECDSRKCNNDNYSEDELQCNEDPCNNCEATFTFEGKPVECKIEEKVKCDVQVNIENGRLFGQMENGYIDSRQLCDGCERDTSTYEYKCEDGFRLDNIAIVKPEENGGYDELEECVVETFYCKSTDNQINRKPNCMRDTCQYMDLENGYITKINAERDSPCRYAEYRCNPGYEMEGERIVHCNPDGTYSDMPRCVKAQCQFSEGMEHARLITEYVDEYIGRMGWYQCMNGTRDYDDVYYNIKCGQEESECQQGDCPAMIENGYLMRVWYWDEKDTHIGEYRCNDGFELRNPKIFSSSKQEYEEKYGWGMCDDDRQKPDPEMMPRCVKPGSPEPCNMPKSIMNGYRVDEIKNEDYDMVDRARYRCNSRYKMVETWRGDIGWCRNDGTFELPYCQAPSDYFEVEFEMNPGMSKMVNAGRVKARHVYADGSSGEWYVGCDDHFNGPAAGAICRSMGFRHGKQVMGDTKMKPIEGLPFGMTNIYCYHDDTLIMR
jgi:hypothetical protein